MFKAGDKVELFSLPTNNEVWGIPSYLLNQIGTIEKIHSIFYENDSFRINFRTKGGDHQLWNIPRYSIAEHEIIRLVAVNKWNPLNYRSHFEPLKLP